MQTLDGDTIYMFYLGEFSDIDGFSNNAKEQLEELTSGKIRFYICPAKEGTGYSIIKISPIFSSGLVDVYENKHDSEETLDIIRVGSIIYEKERTWLDLNYLDDTTKKVPDWQPAAVINKVTLTPMAKAEAACLQQMMKKGRIDKREDGYYYEDGAKLDKPEFDKAVKFGILVRK